MHSNYLTPDGKHPPQRPAPLAATAASPPKRPVRFKTPLRRLRTTAAPARLPHTVQLCIHCRQNPAGFWVSHTGDKTVCRPWCLSCRQELDPDRCDMIPFDYWTPRQAPPKVTSSPAQRGQLAPAQVAENTEQHQARY